VLVVDDIVTNLKVAHGLLVPYQFDVELCSNGVDAIEAVKENDFDIVFMDYKMPSMDGIEAMKHIRALPDRPDYYANLPIIALTANAVTGVKEEFMQSGFSDFLSKPIDTTHLNSILEKWVPKDKQYDMAFIKIVDIQNKKDPAGIQVDGLDVKKGVEVLNGNYDYYLEVLATFYEDGIQKIEEINTALDSGNMYDYVTYLHALKSAAASIGADKLSHAAFDLESAGENEDMAFIRSNNDSFIKLLEKFLRELKETLSHK
jgi:CheY-like chemotaxis protein